MTTAQRTAVFPKDAICAALLILEWVFLITLTACPVIHTITATNAVILTSLIALYAKRKPEIQRWLLRINEETDWWDYTKGISVFMGYIVFVLTCMFPNSAWVSVCVQWILFINIFEAALSAYIDKEYVAALTMMGLSFVAPSFRLLNDGTMTAAPKSLMGLPLANPLPSTPMYFAMYYTSIGAWHLTTLRFYRGDSAYWALSCYIPFGYSLLYGDWTQAFICQRVTCLVWHLFIDTLVYQSWNFEVSEHVSPPRITRPLLRNAVYTALVVSPALLLHLLGVVK